MVFSVLVFMVFLGTGMGLCAVSVEITWTLYMVFVMRSRHYR